MAWDKSRTWGPSRSLIMPRVLGAILMLVLIRGVTIFAFEIDMLQFHHVDSPFVSPNLSFLKGKRLPLKLAEDRFNYSANRVNTKPLSFGTELHPLASSDLLITAIKRHFVISVWIGTPPKEFSVILDIMSSLTMFQCDLDPHAREERRDVYYSRSSSSFSNARCEYPGCQSVISTLSYCSARRDKCRYESSVGPHNVTGTLVKESLTILDTTYRDIIVGCDASRWGVESVGGLLGLARRGWSFLEQIRASNFSYCLRNVPTANRPPSVCIDCPLHLENNNPPLDVRLVNMADSRMELKGLYNIFVRRMYVNKFDIVADAAFNHVGSKGNGGLFVETGITYTHLAGVVYDPLEAALRRSMQNVPLAHVDGFALCYDINNVDIKILPSVTIMARQWTHDNRQRATVNFVLPFANVFETNLGSNGNIACLAFKRSDRLYNLFGTFQQQGFEFIYDVEGLRLRILPQRC